MFAFTFKKVFIEEPPPTPSPASWSSAIIAIFQELLAPIIDLKSLTTVNYVQIKVYMFTSLFLLSTLIICFYDVPVKEKKVIELDYDEPDAMKHSPSQKVEEAAAPSESDPTFSPRVILDEKEVPINTQESVNMEKRVPPLSQEDVFIKPYSHECDASKPTAPQIVKEDDDATASISEAPTSSPREDDSIAISEQSGSPVYSPRNVMFESEDEESVSTLTSTSRRKRFSSGLKRRVPSSDSMGSLRRKLSMKKLSSVKKLLKK